MQVNIGNQKQNYKLAMLILPDQKMQIWQQFISLEIISANSLLIFTSANITGGSLFLRMVAAFSNSGASFLQ